MRADSEAIVSFREALRFWFKLGWISFGGPAGQIAIMHRELVERHRWISEERFLHALNFCMLLPGPEAQQLATYIGWLKHRTLGAVAAGVLFVLPGFLIITTMSALYAMFHDWAPLRAVMFGLSAAVLAIVIEALLRIARRALKTRTQWLIAIASFVAIFAFAAPFPLIVFAAAVVGYLASARISSSSCVRTEPVEAISEGENPSTLRPAQDKLSSGRTERTDDRSSASSLARWSRILAVCLTLWFAPLALIVVTLGSEHVLALEAVFFSKTAVVTFGGAYAVLAYVAQQAVQHYSWLSAHDMMQGLALAETTPGPLIMVLTFVGFIGAFNAPAPFHPLVAGLLGATITTWVTFVPCFLWILLGAPHLERLRQNVALSAALAAVTAAVVGVIANLAVWFGLHVLFRNVQTREHGALRFAWPELSSIDLSAAIIAFAAMLALLRFKTPMLATLGAAAVAGLLLHFY